MTDFERTPDESFAGLDDFPYPPRYHGWEDLRIHYVDEGPRDAPVMLLLHGMPTWAYLYRDVIPPLLEAGYRCVAPDHAGFGRSDKPTDLHWYTIARHTEILASLIHALDLRDVTLVCQDWGGPIGLAQVATEPERFARLCVMNTWLHHPEFRYTEAIRGWIESWKPGGPFCRETPPVGLVPLVASGLIGPEVAGPILLGAASAETLEGEARRLYGAFAAPFRGLSDAAHNGLRRFPLSIPLHDAESGNGAAQTHHHRLLLQWSRPAHFIWGCGDDVFDEAWGRAWAQQMGASFDPISGARHFLQITHGAKVAALLLGRIRGE
jgi:haloalkane dehalogenase